jgi:ABC-type sugar transport system substrate-binding protein
MKEEKMLKEIKCWKSKGGIVMLKRFVGIALALTLIFSLGACGGGGGSDSGDSADKLQVGVLIRDLANPYYVQVKEGAELFLNKKLGEGNYDLTVYESGGEDEKQINDAKAFIAKVKNGNGILYLDANNAPNAAVVADLCEQAKIYWNTVWSYADGTYPFDYEYYTHHQTADNVTGAYETATKMFDTFPDKKGKVVAIQGMLANDASIDREKGWRKALKEYPGVELLDIQPSDWDAKKGLKLIQTWLSKYGDEINGVLVCNDGVAVAVAEGLKAEGLNGKIKITAFDGTPDILPLIESGDVFATFASDGYMEAGYGLAYNYAALNGDITLADMNKEERMFNTKGVLVDKSNLADFKKNYVDGTPDYDYDDLEFCVSSYFDVEDLH